MLGKIVSLDPADDAAGALDRIEWANANRVALVMPAVLRWREVDFVQVQRAGQQRNVEIAIIHPDFKQRRAARETGLAAFANTNDAIQKRWLTSEEVEPIRRLTPPRRFAPNSLRRLFPKRNGFVIAARGLVALATAGMMAAAFVSLLPHAQITLAASSQNLETIVPVRLDTKASDVDVEAGTVPATRIDVIIEDRLSTPTTGKKDIKRYRASGQVTFSNLLATPYIVPRNTVVRTTATSTPARFVTTSDVEVPAGGQATVTVQAIEEGPNSNVGAGQINRVEGVPSLAVSVINSAPTGGGGNETVRAVTKDDYARLRVALREKLLQEAVEKMREQREVVNGGLIVLPETLFVADVQDETFDRFVTEQADEVSLNMRLQVAGLAVDPRDLDAISREVLMQRVPQGFELLSVQSASGEVAEEGTGNDTMFFVNARGTAGANIDEREVKRLVRGKTPAEAQSVLLQNFALVRNPQIITGPDWLMGSINRLPLVIQRIDTEVKRE